MNDQDLKLFIKDIVDILNSRAVRHCYDIDPEDRFIYFQDDSGCDYNGRGPYISVKFRKKYLNFRGFKLSKAEKTYKIYYNQINSVEEFVDDLVVLLRKYFKSFEFTRNSSFLAK